MQMTSPCAVLHPEKNYSACFQSSRGQDLHTNSMLWVSALCFRHCWHGMVIKYQVMMIVRYKVYRTTPICPAQV